MIILGIETSCDETACAILLKKKGRITILSNVVASSALLQAKYGGIIPEQAAREQIKSIIPVLEEALSQAFPSHKLYSINHVPPIDAITVTYGPGLIGSLLVGVETAKTLATIWKKPLIPINHLLGHFYANWITDLLIHRSTDTPEFPCLGLLVSGGHTDLVLFTDHNKYNYLGGTRDDAAGECIDKCARLLGLTYPGGPEISKLAKTGNPNRFKLPIPMRKSKDLDFSYSGLKTAVSNLINKLKSNNLKISKPDFSEPLIHQFTNPQILSDLSASIEETIVKSIIDKVVLAIKIYKVEQIMVAGGVAANEKLRMKLEIRLEKLGVRLHIPPPFLCTDNGAMIASAGFFSKPIPNPLNLQADPNLFL